MTRKVDLVIVIIAFAMAVFALFKSFERDKELSRLLEQAQERFDKVNEIGSSHPWTPVRFELESSVVDDSGYVTDTYNMISEGKEQ